MAAEKEENLKRIESGLTLYGSMHERVKKYMEDWNWSDFTEDVEKVAAAEGYKNIVYRDLMFDVTLTPNDLQSAAERFYEDNEIDIVAPEFLDDVLMDEKLYMLWLMRNIDQCQLNIQMYEDAAAYNAAHPDVETLAVAMEAAYDEQAFNDFLYEHYGNVSDWVRLEMNHDGFPDSVRTDEVSYYFYTTKMDPWEEIAELAIKKGEIGTTVENFISNDFYPFLADGENEVCVIDLVLMEEPEDFMNEEE